MPETYGLPEPEEEPVEKAERLFTEAVAGTSVLRTVVLYALTAILIVSPLHVLAVVPLVLLLATDHDLG